ncbi:Gp138 family membrane-puncturing spike protein, partial [Rhodospirillum sp. A1_3_36]|uniref:Gp138 family membrane-puncturing spike protein n=1 Tax=Rhodospirillum sp. A1_3_36 TaxID=3391666 RepID=UPI0039A6217A
MAQDGRQAEIWTALPGIIQSYDPLAITVTVQPSLKGILTDGRGKATEVTLPLLVDVPVCFPCGGGFTLTFPIKPGDEAMVVFSSRCIDSWWQSGGIQDQAEQRMHDLSDGMAIVGLRSQPRVLNPVADPENVQLRSDDGEQHIT